MRYTQHMHHAASLASFIILALLVNYHVTPDDSTEKPIPASIYNETTAAHTLFKKPQSINANSLVNWHLFGQETVIATDDINKTGYISHLAGNTEGDINPAKLPKSKLGLDVKGLFTHQDTSLGHAIIADESGNDAPYKVGDVIKQRITLHSVYKDFIVISNNQKLEVLNLPEFRTKATFGKQATKRNAFPKMKRFANRHDNS